MSLSAYFTWPLYSARKKCLFWVCAYSEEKCTHFQSNYGVLTSPQVRSDGQPGEESCFYSDWYFQLWDITQTGVCLIEPDLLTTGGASKLRIIKDDRGKWKTKTSFNTLFRNKLILRCRNGWKLQTSEWSCSSTWRSRCRQTSVWRPSPVLRRKMSSCRWISFTLWSVSCLAKILGKAWRNWSRAARPPSSVDASSKRGRLSTLAGQSTVGFQPENRIDWTFVCWINRSASTVFAGIVQ